MKKVVLTFDDGREDQYTNAVRIMNKYNLKGTIFVTTGFVDGAIQNREDLFPSSGGMAMTIEQVRACISQGHEIGAHSDKHTNRIEDVEMSISKLKEWTKDILPSDYKFGFASPSSDIYEENYSVFAKQIQNVKYIRTSVQVRRNGLFYTFLFMINKIIKNNRLFYVLNKKYVKKKYDGIITSVPIRSDTSLENIKYLIESIDKDDICVLLFHGILTKEENQKKKDCWYYSANKFEELCKYLNEQKYTVCTLEKALTNEK